MKTLLSQKDDSLIFHQAAPDSIKISAILNLGDSMLQAFIVPNCSELYKQDGLWYWYNYPLPDFSFFPYCGSCVVKFDNDSTNTIGYEYYTPGSLPYIPPGCPTLEDNESPNEIMIISNYSQGKRHGLRKYYDRKGQLIKTETYENGILMSTVIH